MALKSKAVAFLTTLTLALVSPVQLAAADAGAAHNPEAPDPGATPKAFNIDAPRLSRALIQLTEQAGLQLIYPAGDKVMDFPAKPVIGNYTTHAALDRLLEGTGLRYEFLDPRTISIIDSNARKPIATVTRTDAFRLAQSDFNQPQNPEPSTGKEAQNAANDNSATAVKTEVEEDAERSGIPEILVTGSKLGTLNSDIRRTEDDIQPYVVFDREEIERSGAIDLEQFFKNQLTASVSARSASQVGDVTGNTSSINLRGLGSDETLILVDGRRVAGVNTAGAGTLGQPDLNGIPLSAIERIEVLPTTASGIYGGGATGGVINVVLRRDYSGFGTKVTYGNTFQSDVASRAVELNAGFNLEGGRTSVLMTGTYSESNPLLARERDLVQRGRRHILANNPDQYYGRSQPPLGALPNIRSRRGENLTLKDGTSLNAPITFIPAGYAGVHTDGGAALVANAGLYNLDLANTAQTGGGGNYALLNNPTLESLMVTLRRSITSNVQVFLEFNGSNNLGNRVTNAAFVTANISSTVPNNPFLQDIRVSVPTVGVDGNIRSRLKNRRITTGVIANLGASWKAEMDYTWNRSRLTYEIPGRTSGEVLASINSGAIDVMRDVNEFRVDFTPLESRDALSGADAVLKDAALRIGGALPWSWAAGSPSLSALVERREEDYGSSMLESAGVQLLVPSRSQRVNSVYVEVRLPIVSKNNKVVAIEELELQLAARRDTYKVTGATNLIDLSSPVTIDRFTSEASSVDPTFGIQYKPLADLTLRSSYGTGYLPPSVNQLVPSPPFVVDGSNLIDPRRGNEPLSEITFTSVGSGSLEAEQSESWSAGAILTPRSIPQLRISADWTSIHKRNNINNVTFGDQSAFDNEPYVSGLIVRAPPLEGDPFGVGTVTAINVGLFNIAQLRMKAIDFALDYSMVGHQWGELDFSLSATRMLNLKTQLTPVAPTVENVGAANAFFNEGGGLKWKANGSIVCRSGSWTLGWVSRFFDSYFVNTEHTIDISQGAATVPSQMYHDIFGSYSFVASPGSWLDYLSDTEIKFGVNNLFDKSPPVDVTAGANSLFYSYWGDPRGASYYISLNKTFDR